jgi:N-acetylneuraminate synthase
MNPIHNNIRKKNRNRLSTISIAEIGINHEGSLTVAKEMVDAAHRAGVVVATKPILFDT